MLREHLTGDDQRDWLFHVLHYCRLVKGETISAAFSYADNELRSGRAASAEGGPRISCGQPCEVPPFCPDCAPPSKDSTSAEGERCANCHLPRDAEIHSRYVSGYAPHTFLRPTPPPAPRFTREFLKEIECGDYRVDYREGRNLARALLSAESENEHLIRERDWLGEVARERNKLLTTIEAQLVAREAELGRLTKRTRDSYAKVAALEAQLSVEQVAASHWKSEAEYQRRMQIDAHAQVAALTERNAKLVEALRTQYSLNHTDTRGWHSNTHAETCCYGACVKVRELLAEKKSSK